MKKVKWKEIPRWEKKYEVSSNGDIRNLRTSRFLKPKTDKYGYLSVCLSDRGRKKSEFNHRLVARAWNAKARELGFLPEALNACSNA